MNWKLIRIIDTYAGIPLLLVIFIANRLIRTKHCCKSPRFKRILLIKFWGIGNVFMILPSVQALRRVYPDAHIDFLTLDKNREAIESVGFADNIATVTTATLFSFIASWFRSIRQLSLNAYDVIIDFEQFARFSPLIAHQIGAGEIIGYKTHGQYRHFLYSRTIPCDNSLHISRSFHSLASLSSDDTPAFALPYFGPEFLNSLHTRGRKLLAAHNVRREELTVVIHVGTSENFSERRWQTVRYAELADRLITQFRMKIAFTGLPDESYLVRETLSLMNCKDAGIDVSGHLAFSDYFALIAVAELVISADTAAIHLASALDVPVVGLYGPNIPALYGPWGSKGLAIFRGYDCSPCITNFNTKLNVCRHAEGRGACMKAITVDEVFERITSHFFALDAPCRLERWTGT
jgi:ADP-heptose:LPS heptosyltransferase